MVERRVTFSGDCGQVTAPAFTDTVGNVLARTQGVENLHNRLILYHLLVHGDACLGLMSRLPREIQTIRHG